MYAHGITHSEFLNGSLFVLLYRLLQNVHHLLGLTIGLMEVWRRLHVVDAEFLAECFEFLGSIIRTTIGMNGDGYTKFVDKSS